MVIAQAPGQRPVLHTGDCRLAGHMMQVPDLQALRGKGACLVLDTTYCDAQVGFSSTCTYPLPALMPVWCRPGYTPPLMPCTEPHAPGLPPVQLSTHISLSPHLPSCPHTRLQYCFPSQQETLDYTLKVLPVRELD